MLPFPSPARELPARSPGAVRSPPALPGAPGHLDGCLAGAGAMLLARAWDGVSLFQALGTHNSRNRPLGVKRIKLGSGMRSVGPAVSSSRACRSAGKCANWLLELTRFGVRGRVFVRGRALPSQPSPALLDPSMVGANPEHPSCWQAVGLGGWFESHLSPGGNLRRLHLSRWRQGRCWGPSRTCPREAQESLGSVFR